MNECYKESPTEELKSLIDSYTEWQKNKTEYRKTLIECECGSEFRLDGHHKHVQSIKHIKYMNKKYSYASPNVNDESDVSDDD
jgi:hypothetical protein